jgi:excisionase family DNA binding protein
LQNVPYYTVGGASRELKVSESTIRTWDRKGRLMSVRASNGARLFRSDDVKRLAAERKGVSR